MVRKRKGFQLIKVRSYVHSSSYPVYLEHYMAVAGKCVVVKGLNPLVARNGLGAYFEPTDVGQKFSELLENIAEQFSSRAMQSNQHHRASQRSSHEQLTSLQEGPAILVAFTLPPSSSRTPSPHHQRPQCFPYGVQRPRRMLSLHQQRHNPYQSRVRPSNKHHQHRQPRSPLRENELPRSPRDP